MLRASRPITIALLWLAIVLLPMRAWTMAAMPIVMTAGAVQSIHAADAAQISASAECHGETDGDGALERHACSLCDVCHSAFSDLPAVHTALQDMPPSVPNAATVRPIEPAVLAGPERPPRIVLA